MVDHNGSRPRLDADQRRRQAAVEVGHRIDDKVTFEDMAEGIKNHYKANGRKSFADLKRRIVHLSKDFTKRRAQSITTSDIDAYIAKRQSNKAANGTINRELAALKRMFRLAVQAGKIVKVPHIPMLTENNVRHGFFEQHQFEALLAHLSSYLRAPVTFAYMTGWRMRSEIFKLTWDRVDLDTGTVRLDPGTTKNREGRLIYLPAELLALLNGLWSEHQALYPECPYVFHRNGNEIRYHYVAWRKAVKEAKLEGRIPHDFRRTAVRNMVRAGIAERVAMQMAGHKTRAIFDRYHIVSDGDLKEAAARIGTFGAGHGANADRVAPTLQPGDERKLM